MPNTVEFQAGQDYYFISTSRPGDVMSREGGYCSSHNMKVIFKVAASSAHKPPPAINVPRKFVPEESQSESEYRDYVRPIDNVRQFHSGLDTLTKERYDR